MRPAARTAPDGDATPRNARARRASQARQAGGQSRPVPPAPPAGECSEAGWELMRAMQEYRQQSGRMFPTWSEVLEVVQGLGYQKGQPRP